MGIFDEIQIRTGKVNVEGNQNFLLRKFETEDMNSGIYKGNCLIS
jgi:hypothetical protein